MAQINVSQTLQIKGGLYPYTPVGVHRNGNSQQKSQWSVGMDEEISCFERTITNDWIDENGVTGWGMKPGTQGNIEIIGYDRHTAKLRIAKFVGQSGNWHGYPVNHSEGPRYRPNEQILRCWVDEGALDKSKMAKIKSGK